MTVLLDSPTCSVIAATRADLQQTQDEAAALVGTSTRRWSDWENGVRPMPRCKWTLYRLMVDRHPGFTLAPRQAGRKTVAR